ncbi:primary amine oxidase, liver isozyme-like [Boleophthalmus pectinirostris]|uniref:primary amine oxidase, liver isozyme-like n=1 Tax=Boleophthalmus pectinirostris TaxID=150288 RepID=UPI00242CC93F|nr:primary amine oxidase, liver isozyme-like [Boleophthalmus pectinirostris]
MHALVKWAAGLLVLFSVLLNLALIVGYSRRTPTCAARSKHALRGKHDERSRVFADLSRDEYAQVQQYMLRQKDLDISTRQSTRPDENFLFLIDLRVPPKSQVLAHLDARAPAPRREATVVVFFGSTGHIKEYEVGPLPKPSYHRDVTRERYGTDLPLSARAVTVGEYVLLFQFLEDKVFSPLSTLLRESFGVDHEHKLRPFEQMPRGLRAGDRNTWISFLRDLSGFYLQPVGFEVLVDHRSTNASQWRVERVFYNDQYFESVDALRDADAAGTVKKMVKIPWEDYGSLKPRTRPLQVGPQLVNPEGARYSVSHNHVLYMDWSFAFGLSAVTGMRVFDVRFRDERILYELSLQEAMSVYGSMTPGLGMTKFLDSGFGIGRFAHELVRGVDCPYDAKYVDTYRYIDVSEPTRTRNSMCIFELYLGQPLRRHFSDFFHNSYGGMANSALVLRTITAIENYDYMWDFIFYQTGAVEAKVHATGYISSSFLVRDSHKFGHQVAPKVLGNMHTHFVNFKVDLDVAGEKNIFQTKDMEYRNVSLPWKPEHYATIPHLVERNVVTEQAAAMRHDAKTPRYLHVSSEQKNRWGHERSYRLQVYSFNGDHLPEGQPEEKAMSWARYKVAITKHKDSERSSSSLYNQNNQWSSPVNFCSFIEDDEDIYNQDLVAWVTAGFLHIPHAEDIPNTVTVGNGGGVLLRPHNYFNEDPSIESPDSVYLGPGSESDCDTNRLACLAQETCAPGIEPFTYHGFDGVLKFDE